MGRTLYYSFSMPNKNIEVYEKRYQLAIKLIHEVVLMFYHGDNKDNIQIPLSGYTPHTKVGQYGGIKFNGAHGEECEDFILREHLKENNQFNFTKTNYNDYDIVVQCALLILKDHLGDIVEINIDGDDWTEGMEFLDKNDIIEFSIPLKEGYVIYNEIDDVLALTENLNELDFLNQYQLIGTL